MEVYTYIMTRGKSKIIFLFLLSFFFCLRAFSQEYYFSVNNFGKLTFYNDSSFSFHFWDCGIDNGSYRLNGDISRTSITGRMEILKSENGKPHVLITLDDYIHDRSDLKVLSHELGHVEGDIKYPHQTSMTSEGESHADGYEGGRIATERETKDRSAK